jgi:hypothetical protein
MLVTNKFVMLNFPKTGSSFARKVIKKAYANSKTEFSKSQMMCEELILPNIRNNISKNKSDHHGTYCQIPPSYTDREIVSILRNPLDRFLSIYKYGAWKHSPPLPNDLVRKVFPNFPELTIDEFIEMQNESIKHRLGFDIKKIEIGIQSIQLIQMFFRNPDSTLKNIFSGIYSKEEVENGLGNIKFLSQENLREDLFHLLIKCGFKEDELAFIQAEKASNVSDYGTNDKSIFLTQNLKQYLEDKEWLYNSFFNNSTFNYLKR